MTSRARLAESLQGAAELVKQSAMARRGDAHG